MFSNRVGGGIDGSNRTLDSDSGSNDESLTERSPLYGFNSFCKIKINNFNFIQKKYLITNL